VEVRRTSIGAVAEATKYFGNNLLVRMEVQLQQAAEPWVSLGLGFRLGGGS